MDRNSFSDLYEEIDGEYWSTYQEITASKRRSQRMDKFLKKKNEPSVPDFLKKLLKEAQTNTETNTKPESQNTKP